MIAISKFSSLKSALDVARRLKGLWGDPLTWTVKDMHVVSCHEDDNSTILRDSNNRRQMSEALLPGRDFSPDSTMEWNKLPWGCNAKIMLMGEEMEQKIAGNNALL